MGKTVSKTVTKKKAAPPPPPAKKQSSGSKLLSSPPPKKTKVINKKKDKAESLRVLSPKGRFSFPRIAEPNPSDSQFDKNKYTTDFLITRETWDTDPAAKAMRQAVLKVGRAYFEDDTLTLKDFNNPFKDMDKVEGKEVADSVKGHVAVRAKSDTRPVFIGAKKNSAGGWSDLPESRVYAIKGGDWGRILVSVYAYADKGSGAGVSFGLENVQWIEAGESFGGSNRASLNMIDEAEVELEDPDDSEEEYSEDEESSNSYEDESSDEDSDLDSVDDTEEEEPAPKKGKRRQIEDEEDF